MLLQYVIVISNHWSMSSGWMDHFLFPIKRCKTNILLKYNKSTQILFVLEFFWLIRLIQLCTVADWQWIARTLCWGDTIFCWFTIFFQIEEDVPPVWKGKLLYGNSETFINSGESSTRVNQRQHRRLQWILRSRLKTGKLVSACIKVFPIFLFLSAYNTM